MLAHFWCPNGPFWGRKSKPKRTSTRKRLHRLNAIKTSTFSIKLGVRRVRFGSPDRGKSMKKRMRDRSACFHQGFVALGPFLAPFGEPKGRKWTPKRPKWTSKGPQRRPKGRPKGPKWTPRALHMPRFWHPWGQRRPGGPHGAKKAPKSSPK